MIWDLWKDGGPFIGENRSHAIVTVEKDWWLYPHKRHLIAYDGRSSKIAQVGDGVRAPLGAAVRTANGRTWWDDAGTGDISLPPIRWFQRENNLQVEDIVPNVRNISIDRSVDTDAATCTITIANQKMHPNIPGEGVEQPQPGQLGMPGYYTPTRGEQGLQTVEDGKPVPTHQEKAALWGQQANEWRGVLVPNALIRTYQGYGGHNKTLEQCETDGNLVRTGVWLIDKVSVSSSGEMTLECRDMAKLLLEQQIYPPFIHPERYPIEFYRWKWVKKKVPTWVRNNPVFKKRRARFVQSCNDLWYPNSVVPGKGVKLHGHYGSDAFDGKSDTFWLSVGNSHPSRPFATDWIEFDCGEEISAVGISPWGGPYTAYVSVKVNGVWQGANTIPYDHSPLIGRQSHVVDTGADIPYISKSSVGPNGTTYIGFKKCKPERVRVSFRDHKYTQWGQWHYRVGVREIMPVLQTGTQPQYRYDDKIVKVPGNYTDYTDIVRAFLLWAGWWLFPQEGFVPRGQSPKVFGNLESTGAWAEEPLPRDLFDKKPIIDAINAIKEIVNYNFWIDEDGAARFEAPNFYKPGNFDISGTHTTFTPEISELHNLISYGTTTSDAPLRSELIVATADPEENYQSTVTTRYKPPSADMLRGMVKPAMWVNGQFTSKNEQKVMAELIGLRIFFAQRQAQAECVANPCISINDQVRMVERVTSDSYIHYVRGMSTNHDLLTGQYTMTLTTHWMGNKESWVIQPPKRGIMQPRYYIVQTGDTFEKICIRLEQRYGTKWTPNFLKWVNQELLNQTGGELHPGMVLAV